MSKLDNILMQLPHFFDKSVDSNNYQFSKAIGLTFDNLTSNITELKQSIQIDTAEGQNLDDIASLFNIERLNRTDMQLRNLIQGYWQSRLGGGTKQSIISIVSSVFDIDESNITLTELSELKFKLTITINTVQDLDLIFENIFDNVNPVKAAGTMLTRVDFNSEDNVFLTNFSEVNGEDYLL